MFPRLISITSFRFRRRVAIADDIKVAEQSWSCKSMSLCGGQSNSLHDPGC